MAYVSKEQERRWRVFAQRCLDLIDQIQTALPLTSGKTTFHSMDRPGLLFEWHSYSDPEIIMSLPRASFSLNFSLPGPSVYLRDTGYRNLRISNNFKQSYASQAPGVMEHLRSTPARLEAILNAIVNNAPLDPSKSWEATLKHSIATLQQPDIPRLRHWVNVWGSPNQKTGVALVDNFVDNTVDAKGWITMLQQTLTMGHPEVSIGLPDIEMAQQ